MVYVLNKNGKPLMPTKRRGKVRHLLEDGKAKVAKLEPSAIQLLYDSTGIYYNRLKEEYTDVSMTYGYTAKNTRNRNGLEKDHAADARCTGGNPLAVPLDAIYMQKAAGKRNRQIHKATVNKGGKRKLNQSPKCAFGFQLFDRVQMPGGRKGFIFGRRSSGSFDVRTLDGAKLSAGISCKKLNLLSGRTAILTEKEDMRLPPHA
ncbi:MAG: RRXRR domain-containing protein [Clostridiales bacterium]|jgi:N6-L-threonylcarbamoyladenine synthase|nr:RRXRR domain-containing protein [Clostridiales bacterium]